MRRKRAIGLEFIAAAVGLMVPACSSSSSSSSPADSGGVSDTGAAGDSTTGSDTGSASDSGASVDTSSSSDSGGPIDSSHDDVVDAPYCAATQALLDAGAIGAGTAVCLDFCCTDLTACVQTTGCPMVFRCVTTCVHQSDAGAAACASMCEADASSQIATDVNQLGTCLKQHGC